MALTPTQNPILAPEYNTHRIVKDAVDTGIIDNERLGMNMQSYSHAHVQVIPTGGANPAVKILFWSEAASRYIDPHSDDTVARSAGGVDTPYEFSFEPRGRKFFVFVTAGVANAQQAQILVAGFNVERV